MSKKPNQLDRSVSLSQIGQLVGAKPPVLPGEDVDLYKEGLNSTITELGAATPLQIYLAEKIFDSLWWIRRYESLKRVSIARAMAGLLLPNVGDYKSTHVNLHMTQALLDGNLEDPALLSALNQKNYSFEVLTQEAMLKRREQLFHVDQQIALCIKTLNGLQSSYETLVNRRVHVERLQLQNELLRRDLEAIDVQVITHDKPAKTSRKSA